ncbi:hypothetical protein FRC00_007165, partial [Tulasnella sp. 408]
SDRTRFKGKGKARANAIFQKPQGQTPPRGSSSSIPNPQHLNQFLEGFGDKGYQPRPGRLSSASYEPGRASYQKATAQRLSNRRIDEEGDDDVEQEDYDEVNEGYDDDLIDEVNGGYDDLEEL